ncbi:hypothetical protein PS639_03019 [Pseudomonas fluorescens]|nr:hypothetical protein PS639_03019 [Pseudomonas fluorescens]
MTWARICLPAGKYRESLLVNRFTSTGPLNRRVYPPCILTAIILSCPVAVVEITRWSVLLILWMR